MITHKNILHWPVFLTVCSLFLCSCQSGIRFATKAESLPSSTIQHSNNTIPNDILSEARDWIGTPYCYGGNSTKCADCSGFVHMVFRNCGKIIPRTAADQYNQSEKISSSDARAGDLAFFSSGSNITHVGIYAGNNQIIHASSSKGVIIQPLNDEYLSKTFVCYGRY